MFSSSVEKQTASLRSPRIHMFGTARPTLLAKLFGLPIGGGSRGIHLRAADSSIADVMSEKSSTTLPKLEETKRLLAHIPVMRSACELDLLMFLHRHPRALLTNEQLAAFVGYDIKQVAQAVDAFIDAGLLKRTQNSMHAARMYLLVLDGPQGGGLTALLKLASTRQGRREILQLLGTGQPQTAHDITQEKRGPPAIA